MFHETNIADVTVISWRMSSGSVSQFNRQRFTLSVHIGNPNIIGICTEHALPTNPRPSWENKPGTRNGYIKIAIDAMAQSKW